MLKAHKVLCPGRRGKQKNSLGWIGGLLVLSLAACAHVDYQDRALSPLKPMKSVVHTKSETFDVPPKVLEGMRPEYPEIEAKQGEPGFVSIICTISAKGKLIDFEIETMTNPAFAYEAVRALQKWRFAPATKDGHPVVGKLRVPMHFNPV
jgi:TonB family protein